MLDTLLKSYRVREEHLKGPQTFKQESWPGCQLAQHMSPFISIWGHALCCSISMLSLAGFRVIYKLYPGLSVRSFSEKFNGGVKPTLNVGSTNPWPRVPKGIKRARHNGDQSSLLSASWLWTYYNPRPHIPATIFPSHEGLSPYTVA